MAEPFDGYPGICLVRERTSGTDRATKLTEVARHQCADRLELQHRAGTHHRGRHAAASACATRHYLHRGRRNRRWTERRANGALAETQRRECRTDHLEKGQE